MEQKAEGRKRSLKMITEQKQELQANTDFYVVTKEFQEEFCVQVCHNQYIHKIVLLVAVFV